MISFFEKFPEYSKLWDYDKNIKKPSEVSYGSGTKYWWKCNNGHSWLSSPNVMSRGTKCPYCSGLLPIVGENDLQTTHPNILKMWDYDKNNELEIFPTQVKYGSKTKVYWKCDKNHSWFAPVSRITIEKRGCPYCSNQKVLKGYNDLKTKFPILALEWNYQKNDKMPEDILFGSTYNAWWVCGNCGFEWQTRVVHRTGSKKTNCPECAKKKFRQTQLKNQIKKEGSFADNYPELLKEWNYQRNIGIDPYSYTSKSAKKVWWTCPKGHDYQSVIYSRTKNKTGCPICAGKVVLKGFNDLETLKPELIKEWDYKKNNEINLYPDKIVCHSEKKAWWICPSCGCSYKAAISHRVNGTACPECAKELKTSFAEQAIYYYFSKICLTENRWNVLGTEVDIFLHDFNVGIEYDGEYYHDGPEALKREKEKYDFLKKNGILLIRVKENFQNKELKSYADMTIEINHKNYDFIIKRVIMQILDFINDIFGQWYDLDVDLKRDRQEIYSNYIKKKRQDSVASLYPEKLKGWDYSKNKISPYSLTPGSAKKVWWKCDKKHSYEQALNAHIKFNLHCPYCSNQKVLKGYNDLLTINPKLASQWNYKRNNILPNEVVAGSNKRVWWLCDNCGNEWTAIIGDRHKRKSKCPKCHK